MLKNKSGFTLVELMIVIVVIVILATVTAVSYTSTQARARDTKRKADLTDIAEAVQLYRQKFNTDASGLDPSVQKDSGGNVIPAKYCGDNNSNGWFGYANGGGDETILTCLQNNGYLDGGGTFADPSNCITNTIALPGKTCKDGRAYMKYTCNDGTANSVTYLYAKLETEDNTSAVATKTGSTACSGYPRAVTTYGMNYVVVVN